MKKGLILLAFSLLAIGFAIVGCSKSSEVSIKDADQTTVLDRDCGGFSGDEIAAIGSTHNTTVRALFENFDFEADNLQAQLEARFATLCTGQSQEYINYTFSSAYASSSFDINSHASQISDDLVYVYYASLNEAIDEANSMTELRSDLSDLKALVLANLSCSDRDLMLTAISVAVNSASLWSPVSFGGQGYYDELESIRGLNGDANYRWTWKGVLRNDLIGATEVFFTLGTGLLVPGTNAAIALDIAASAGFHSAWAFAEH